jgi:osmotically inducible lipoprotein OsmB
MPQGERNMKKLAILGAAALMLAGCQSDGQTERAVGGGLIGAGAGAIIGGAVTGSGRGAAVGAAIGGISGAAIGAATAPRYCRAYDRRGRRIRVRC